MKEVKTPDSWPWWAKGLAIGGGYVVVIVVVVATITALVWIGENAFGLDSFWSGVFGVGVFVLTLALLTEYIKTKERHDYDS